MSLEAYSLAARQAAGLPDDWYGWLFTATEPKGVLVRGAVCPKVTRGKRKGQPNWRKKDMSTDRTVLIYRSGEGRARQTQIPLTMAALMDKASDLDILSACAPHLSRTLRRTCSIGRSMFSRDV